MRSKINLLVLLSVIAILIFTIGVVFYLGYQNSISKVLQQLHLEEDGQYLVNKKEISYDNEVFVSETYPEITHLSNTAIQDTFNSLNDTSASFQREILGLKSQSDEINKYKSVSSPACKYSLSNDFEVILKNKRYLSLELNSYTYTCGVHGNGGNTGEVFDLQTGRKLELKDLFKTKDYLEKIYKIVRTKLCLNQKVPDEFGDVCESTERLFSKKDTDQWFLKGTMPEDKNYSAFYITKTGIIFIFNQYQIASYAEGQFKVEATFDELREIINLDFN